MNPTAKKIECQYQMQILLFWQYLSIEEILVGLFFDHAGTS